MARDFIDYEAFQRDDIRSVYETRRPDDLPFALGKISHVALMVKDMQRSLHFYTQVLGLEVSDAYPESMMPGGMIFLRCNEDHHGVALVGAGPGEDPADQLHHFAFEVNSLEEVFRARDHLERQGVEMIFQGRRRAGQQIAIEFKDPDGHNLEICWGIDRIKSGEAARRPEEWVAAASLEDAVANAPPGQDTSLTDRSLLRR